MHLDRTSFSIVFSVLLCCACDGPSGVDAGADSGPPIDSGTLSPVLRSIAWEPVGSCTDFINSDYAVTVVADDPDTDAALLTISGIPEGCLDPISGPSTTITCPNAATTYPGTLRVVDPEGNMDTATFSLTRCLAGSVDF